MKKFYALSLILCISSFVIPAFGGKIADQIPNAIETGDIEKLKKVLNNFDEADRIKYINISDENGQTPLLSAIEKNNEEMVKLLLNNGSEMSINDANKENLTPITKAVHKNNIEIVDSLLKNPRLRDINIPGECGNTVLHYVRKNPAMFKQLIKYGAIESINKANWRKQTPLSGAIQQKNEEVVKLLLHLGAKITNYIEDMFNPLHQFIDRGPNIPDLVFGDKKLIDCCTAKELKELNQIKMNVSSHNYNFKFGDDYDLNLIYKNY